MRGDAKVANVANDLLSQRLKAETAALHHRLETLPFFQTLQAGALEKIALISWLRCLAVVHAVLERELSRTSHRRIRTLGALTVPKIPFLVDDLAAMEANGLPSVMPALRIAIDFAAEILTAAADPLTLVGCLYVLEGSQIGGLALKPAYGRCLGESGLQLSYVGCYGGDTEARWDAFRACLDSFALENAEAESVVNAASRCFEQIGNICTALHPYVADSLRHHAAGINFEAGDHVIPENPREIELALRVGRSMWDMYPYLQCRFGERGKRFTSSDSCWLVALMRMPVETATENLKWLRTVLASRGIPTVILEEHLSAILTVLAAEFAEGIELGARYEPFLSGLDLERRTLGGIEGALLQVEQFEPQFQACAGFTVPSAAKLIASAWLDEQSGITGSLASVRDWFSDPTRFSDDWVSTVDRLMAALGRATQSPC
jgi:heme oxygenase